MPTILITLPFPEEIIAPLRQTAPDAEIILYPAKSAAEVPAEIWQKVEVLYTNQALPERDQAPNLKWIQCHWAGIDGLLKFPIIQNPEIQVTTLSGAAVPQMGEYILMMLLALARRLPDLMANQHAAEWPKDRWERFLPRELNQSTVGIVGYGSLGRETARLLHTFGSTVLAAKRDTTHPAHSGYTPPNYGDPEGRLVRRLYPVQELRSMFKLCDFVVVAVPLTPETRHLIGAAELAALTPSAALVDVSRGGVIDHAALIQALKNGRLAGAALDVCPQEPLPADNPLWQMPNVLITPHIAGATAQYDQRAVQLLAANLKRYQRNQPLFNRFYTDRGY